MKGGAKGLVSLHGTHHVIKRSGCLIKVVVPVACAVEPRQVHEAVPVIL